MKTLADLKSTLARHKPELQRKYCIKQLGIFGSYVDGSAMGDSDVDILVEFSEPIGLEFVSLADELEKLLGVKVDLVSVNAIKANMLPYVEQDLVYV
ncbi:MAG: nucleotidyltransferase family protein [bacterium]